MKEDQERMDEETKRRLEDADAHKEALDDFSKQEGEQEGGEPVQADDDGEQAKEEAPKEQKIKLVINKRITGDVLEEVLKGVSGDGRFHKVDPRSAESVIIEKLNSLKGED